MSKKISDFAVLKFIVSAMGVALIIGIGLLFFTLYQQLSKSSNCDKNIELKIDGEIEDIKNEKNNLIITTKSKEGNLKITTFDNCNGDALKTIILR